LDAGDIEAGHMCAFQSEKSHKHFHQVNTLEKQRGSSDKKSSLFHDVQPIKLQGSIGPKTQWEG
jgi:hypothetical protein